MHHKLPPSLPQWLLRLIRDCHFTCSSSVLLYKRSGQVNTQNLLVSLKVTFSLLWYSLSLYPGPVSEAIQCYCFLFGTSETVSSVTNLSNRNMIHADIPGPARTKGILQPSMLTIGAIWNAKTLFSMANQCENSSTHYYPAILQQLHKQWSSRAANPEVAMI